MYYDQFFKIMELKSENSKIPAIVLETNKNNERIMSTLKKKYEDGKIKKSKLLEQDKPAYLFPCKNNFTLHSLEEFERDNNGKFIFKDSNGRMTVGLAERVVAEKTDNLLKLYNMMYNSKEIEDVKTLEISDKFKKFIADENSTLNKSDYESYKIQYQPLGGNIQY